MLCGSSLLPCNPSMGRAIVIFTGSMDFDWFWLGFHVSKKIYQSRKISVMGLGKRGKQKTFKLATAMVETIVFSHDVAGLFLSAEFVPRNQTKTRNGTFWKVKPLNTWHVCYPWGVRHFSFYRCSVINANQKQLQNTFKHQKNMTRKVNNSFSFSRWHGKSVEHGIFVWKRRHPFSLHRKPWFNFRG